MTFVPARARGVRWAGHFRRRDRRPKPVGRTQTVRDRRGRAAFRFFRFRGRADAAKRVWCAWYAHLLPKSGALKRKSFALRARAVFNRGGKRPGAVEEIARFRGNLSVTEPARDEMVQAPAAQIQKTADAQAGRGQTGG